MWEQPSKNLPGRYNALGSILKHGKKRTETGPQSAAVSNTTHTLIKHMGSEKHIPPFRKTGNTGDS